MEIFGVGILELVFIFIIMLVVLGPRDMVVTGRKLGLLIRRVLHSPIWAQLMDASREIREMPVKLVREAGFEDEMQTLQRSLRGQYNPSQQIEREIKAINEQVNPSIPTDLEPNPYLRKDEPEKAEPSTPSEPSQDEGATGETPLLETDESEQRIDPRPGPSSSIDDLYRNLK